MKVKVFNELWARRSVRAFLIRHQELEIIEWEVPHDGHRQTVVFQQTLGEFGTLVTDKNSGELIESEPLALSHWDSPAKTIDILTAVAHKIGLPDSEIVYHRDKESEKEFMEIDGICVSFDDVTPDVFYAQDPSANWREKHPRHTILLCIASVIAMKAMANKEPNIDNIDSLLQEASNLE